MTNLVIFLGFLYLLTSIARVNKNAASANEESVEDYILRIVDEKLEEHGMDWSDLDQLVEGTDRAERSSNISSSE